MGLQRAQRVQRALGALQHRGLSLGFRTWADEALRLCRVAQLARTMQHALSYLVSRSMEDFVTWVDTSRIKRTIMRYNDKLDDYDLL